MRNKNLIVAGLAILLSQGADTCAQMPTENDTKKAELLRQMAERPDINNEFLNSARSRDLQDRIANEGDELGNLRLLLAREHLNAGQTDLALATLEPLRPLFESFSYSEGLDTVAMLTAICHLRAGEQVNCINHHNAQSCIFPFEGGGIYNMKEHTVKAAAAYTDILKGRPNDVRAAWLLNVATMSMTGSNADVPSQWRVPLVAPVASSGIGPFRDVAVAAGVAHQGLAGGVCSEDFDQDGLIDLMVTSMGVKDQMRLYVNRGDGTFEDRTDKSGLKGQTGGLNMVHADYDNDGDHDVLVLRGGWMRNGSGKWPNSLLRNNGDATFTDVTEGAGITGSYPSHSAGWADMDLDGDLDLYIANESLYLDTFPLTKTVDLNQWYPHQLYSNNGDGTFTEVSAAAGLTEPAFIKGCIWADVNNDLYPDLYMSIFGSPNRLYINRGRDAKGQVTFTESAVAAGVDEPMFSFSTWAMDHDNDGDLDLFALSYHPWRDANLLYKEYLNGKAGAATSRLYENNGKGSFTDRTTAAGLNKVMLSMGCNFGDLDNDGHLDFYTGTGEPDLTSLMPNRMFRNNGDRTYTEVTTEGRFGHLQKGHAIVFSDLDNDGDQDVYEVMGGAMEGDGFANVLYENPGNTNHWLALRLEGTTSARCAMGARVKVVVTTNGKERSLSRWVGTGGMFGSSSLRVEIGLAQADIIRSVSVLWPTTGTEQVYTGMVADREYRLTEGASEATELKRKAFRFK